MVWNPKREEVNVNRMMIYSVIPFLNIYSHWRIQKFWVINLLILPFQIASQFISTYTMNYNTDSNLGIFPILVMLISLALNVLLTKHFAQKYNLSVRDDITED
tara:strand:- start:218 stop:526 length:309 start_codon:yes stop_codon:yes gene_type:complete